MGMNICTYKAGPNSHKSANLHCLEANLHKLASAPRGCALGPLPANLLKIRVQIRASLRPKQICQVN